MILGFTGTREAPTPAQLNWLDRRLKTADDVFEIHHGMCVGSDAIMHRLAILYGIRVVLHPPVKEQYADLEARDNARRTNSSLVIVNEPKPYLDRDIDIVDASDQLWAMPNSPWRRGSGTWYTIDYAHNLGKPIVICHPDGEVERRNG